MQTETGRQLATELQIRRQTATNGVLKDFFNRIPTEWQLHQLREHLKTSERLR